jgi:branched-chain amino acid transport system substrate-binding protein
MRCAAILILMALTIHIPALADGPIKVGVSLAQTGRFAVIANMQAKAFRLWERDVNQHGGIQGKTVQVIIRDDHSDPHRAVRIYEDLLQHEGVDFLFGPYSTLITEAVLPLAEKARCPLLITGAAGDSLWEKGYHYALGVYTPSSKFSAGFIELLVREGIDKLAVVYQDDPFSQDLARSVQVLCHRYGLTVSLCEKLTPDVSQWDDYARRIRTEETEAVIVCGHFDEAVGMRRAFKRIGWQPQAYYASVGPPLPAYYQTLGADADRVFSTSLFEQRANFPGANHFVEAFTAAFGQAPGYHAALAYAGGQVLAAAIRTADSLDREKVRATLFGMDTMTIIGRYGVDRTGKQMRQHNFIIQWQAGKKEIVWPEAVQSAAPLFEFAPTDNMR